MPEVQAIMLYSCKNNRQVIFLSNENKKAPKIGASLSFLMDFNDVPANSARSAECFLQSPQKAVIGQNQAAFSNQPFQCIDVEVHYHKAEPCQSPSSPRERFRGTGASSGRVG